MVDITEHFERKFAALALHSSQFSEETLAMYRIYFREKAASSPKAKTSSLAKA